MQNLTNDLPHEAINTDKNKLKLIDFEKDIQEVSGFSFDEKHRLYELLTNFGIPVCAFDESKEDWELLKTLLVKMTLGQEVVPAISNDSLA